MFDITDYESFFRIIWLAAKKKEESLTALEKAIQPNPKLKEQAKANQITHS